ncbi:TIGR02270 family protein [Nannocystis bainbridge]|uniref:TIGR02270 family protein n=1 Tax=Nannocystis bainbridge TaxID=2995303 RepID=A0ABT5DYQ6_9BACT|nr:TIGR02270 family protein [Nannocystis bainbridge]MDC0718273.1 TIGR02270 family protein [Nannocystis bainbridge]
MRASDDEPLWDVLEEHLDEAEFLWESWEGSLVAPNYTLAEVEANVESRLHAHLDGLVIGGPVAAQQLLVPALESDESGRVAAAAAALLLGPDETALSTLFAALHELPAARPALVRAFACIDRAELLPRLRACLTDVDEAIVGAAAEALVFRHEPLGEALSVLLASDEPALRGLGLRALAGEPGGAGQVRAIQAALADEAPQVVDAAIAAGLVLAPAPTWTRVRSRAEQPDGALALLLLALRDGPGDRAALLAALGDASRRPAAIYALGHVGAPELVDACLEWLDDGDCGPLVGEAMQALTGLDLDEAGVTATVEDEATEHTPEHDLARPDPLPAMQWWLRQRPRFADGQRYLQGEPRARAGVIEALTSGPMRRRPALLLDLQLKAPRGALLRLQTAAPTARQRRELAELRRALG